MVSTLKKQEEGVHKRCLNFLFKANSMAVLDKTEKIYLDKTEKTFWKLKKKIFNRLKNIWVGKIGLKTLLAVWRGSFGKQK